MGTGTGMWGVGMGCGDWRVDCMEMGFMRLDMEELRRGGGTEIGKGRDEMRRKEASEVDTRDGEGKGDWYS